MSVVSSSIPNLINGISEQNPTQRNLNQAETQVNAQSSIVKGLTKRPPLEWVSNLLSSQVFSTNTAIHPFIRDNNNQYIIAAYNGGIKAYELDGTSKTVTISNGSSYLATTNPKDDYKFVSVADTTFILNKSKIPAMAATTSAAKVNEALVYVKQSNFGRTYTITLTHPSMNSGNPVSTTYAMPNGDNVATQGHLRDTATIASILKTGSGGSPGTHSGTALDSSGISNYFTIAQYNSVLHIKPTDNSAAFTITTSDGAGDSGMYAIKDTINDFTNLPYYAPNGYIVKITGDEGQVTTDYYVKYSSTEVGTWTECIGPGLKTTIDPATMPHKLVRATNGTFTFSECSWDLRNCGDDATNPIPSFIGYAANNITFYKNRFGILADENIILSEAGGYFNFFSQTVAAALATDVVDLAATSNEVSVLKHAIPFNEELILFSDLAQFKVEGGTSGLSSTDSSITLTTRFENKADIAPVGAGNYLYFAQSRGDTTALREYYVQPDTTNYDSVDITVGVPSLISNSCYKLISNTIENTIIALEDDGASSNNAPYTAGSNVNPTKANRMNVYKYFWNNNDKVQSAWSYWDFTGIQIIGAFSYESNVYVIANERQKANLYKIDLRNLEDANLNMQIHLDQRCKLNGSYNGGTGITTFTIPYTVATGLQCINAATGSDLTIASQSGTTVTVAGNIASAYFGFQYTTLYTLSTQYLREPGKVGGLVSLTAGRLQVRTMSFDYASTGFFQVVVGHNNRDDRTYTFNGYIIDSSASLIERPVLTNGTFRVPIQAKNTDHTVSIKSSSYLPVNLVSAEMEGFYYRRSTRV
ncbi:tail tubular protein B [uncultured phage_MedDCM-OCT-S28-C10]|uniref:Tail tubular protein B n=1 Tax=uncultured phage_MedDCM-OCT-S28-C10 TaxID=2741077 RepID=A0A6S4PI54_9CAUD|nr:tail protein [uncultured phage_MedDCM-OCT-S28-C10]BAQ94046.1 tail tubular protein B [uncultured phage_MedDCM-OCT-S28-C10]BAR25341.1 tail tubular protein B [uncultured Mediterranean phage uvMED]